MIDAVDDRQSRSRSLLRLLHLLLLHDTSRFVIEIIDHIIPHVESDIRRANEVIENKLRPLLLQLAEACPKRFLL